MIRNQQYLQEPPRPRSTARPPLKHAKSLAFDSMSASQSSSCWLCMVFLLQKCLPSCTSTIRLRQHCRVDSFLPRLGSLTSLSFLQTSFAMATASQISHLSFCLPKLPKLEGNQETGVIGSTATEASSRDGKSYSTSACCDSSASISITIGA